jgi:inner membrane protein involved in colicin E2 resistance
LIEEKPWETTLVLLFLTTIVLGYLTLERATMYTYLWMGLMLIIALVIDGGKKWINPTLTNIVIVLGIALVVFIVWIFTFE